MGFDEQLRLVLDVMEPAERVVFLAGVRFVQGHAEYGDSTWTAPLAELEHMSAEELADDFVYSHIRMARSARGER